MKRTKMVLLMTAMALVMASCREDDEQIVIPRQARVTLLATHNGMGDNGYIDEAVEGVFAFSFQTHTPIQMLLPHDAKEAEQMYNEWIAENAAKDSMVLVVGTEAYQDFVENTPVEITGKGTRVLLFESIIKNQPDGVSAIMIDRYGAAYLAGAMSKDFDALIIAATPGYNTLVDAINGFTDGWNAHHAEGKKIELYYLSDNESGFAIPDSAYRFISARIAQTDVYREMVFPLLGGSGIGILRGMNDVEMNFGLVIGMDVDQSGQSPRLPFSMVVHTGIIVHRYLDDWLHGVEWPKSDRLGLPAGGADVKLSPSFYKWNSPKEDYYRNPSTFQLLYDSYREEAIQKEIEYESTL